MIICELDVLFSLPHNHVVLSYTHIHMLSVEYSCYQNETCINFLGEVEVLSDCCSDPLNGCFFSNRFGICKPCKNDSTGELNQAMCCTSPYKAISGLCTMMRGNLDTKHWQVYILYIDLHLAVCTLDAWEDEKHLQVYILLRRWRLHNIPLKTIGVQTNNVLILKRNFSVSLKDRCADQTREDDSNPTPPCS